MSHLYRNPPKTGLYWLAFYQDSKLHRESLHTKDKPTAKYLQHKKDTELASGKTIPKADNLISPTQEEYTRFNEHRRTRDVNLSTEARIKRFLTHFGITTFNQITEKKLQEYLNHRLNVDKVSLWEINNTISNLKSWLNFCVQTKHIPDNPLQGVKKYRIPENPKRYLSTDEISKLLLTANNPGIYADKKPVFYPVIATGIYTGMRQAELFSLEWPDIDFTRSVITIRNKEGFTTKSKKFRIIPLHKRLKAILKPLKKETGRCFDTANQRRVFGRISNKAGLSGIGWHTLRHTFASQAVMAGVPLVTVSKWLGHASITTTMIYSHLSKDHLRDEIKKLSF